MSKFVNLLVLLISMLVGCGEVYAGVEHAISGYFDTDDCVDELTYSYESGVIDEMEARTVKININLHCANGNSRRITRLYNMSSSHLSVLTGKRGEIIIFEAEDIATQDKSYCHYQYNESTKDWYLTKLVVLTTVTMDDPPLRYPEYAFSYYPGITSIAGETIDNAISLVESEDKRIKRMNNVLVSWYEDLMNIYKNNKMEAFAEYAKKHEEVAELMLNVPVSEKNVEMYNNIGFILSHADEETDLLIARSILEQVVANVPGRTPAYLNLADVYDALGLPKSAIPLYRKYIVLMVKEGKKKKIPIRVVNKLAQ